MNYFSESSGLRSTNYAQTSEVFVPLRANIGRNLAGLYLGLDADILEGIVGRYSRGKYKGQLRGAIQYTKVIHGGWMRNVGIVARGIFGAAQIVDAFTRKTIYT